jgi:c-di-GMP-binding flagellar brake protein YcgR
MEEIRNEDFDEKNLELICHVDFTIPVGEKVLLYFPGVHGKLKTEFLGVDKKKYIIVRLPEGDTENKFHKDQQVTLRYINDSLVCGFNTTISGIIAAPYPLIFLDYPECIEILNMRNDDRVTCFIPAKIHWETKDIVGKIIDLSKGGCKIVADPFSVEWIPSINIETEISFQLQDRNNKKNLTLRSKIKRIVAEESKLILSFEFFEHQEEIEKTISDYVEILMEYFEK